ncbi:MULTISPECIES: flagellin N-terminal helical domain-containing protein [unclassified Janthinobacterium]|uniref:flagellin N-terminal helical domain-containing protein n=1 Tax=unclassified Janthinobacterium TaxID=2610881 RepID=UPI000C16EA64|nr:MULTISPECIES: flagellin [unclassified Janthinobacterium]MDN2676860.1 flagellin [Janthinobacterium sp. SUN033]MDN2714645.1 flagellin [Janthinobacterium sp. SUN120]MDO8040517.1 flagellin [Janthinobacterium sp. SUN137]MDO8046892.1 flagellin [Janthinobacterium sp. SUN211]MDO8064416.1 flagellin [Janthinobacterium sp. SUN206]
MLSLHTNNASLSAQNSIAKTQSQLSTSMTRLSTGYRINSAMDDAAGLQIATRLKAQTSGMTVAMSNTQNSTSMLQTAEGAFGEVTNMLVRMKDLATQAADASSNTSDKDAMQAEYDALGLELSNVMKNTTFGGQALLTGGTIASAMTFQIGAAKSETMSINLSTSMGSVTAALGSASANFGAAGLGTELTASANAAIGSLVSAIDSIGVVRSALGAAANRLDHVNSNLSNISTNTKAATGRIMDVDFATESSNMTSSQMLLQAGTAMLKQSNSMSSMVMSLLQ